ncbi:MAG: triosephosphate isomerase [Parasphingorhabdus sp.]|jgi:triosephosphate isomerase
MRQPMVAGNWKMNGSAAFAAELSRSVAASASNVGAVDVVLCPPAIYLSEVISNTTNSVVAVGGQNLDYHADGAYTGEISAPMLKDVGASCVLAGHSERRAYYGESSQIVGQKTVAALSHGLMPIVCVGETLQQREADQTESVVGAQLQAVIDAAGIDAFAGIVVAYEPVWAIGTGMTASPQQAQAVHAYIRGLLSERNVEIANGVRILYGGSVKPDNAEGLFANADIDGGLIGGASLNADDFLAICRAAG